MKSEAMLVTGLLLFAGAAMAGTQPGGQTAATPPVAAPMQAAAAEAASSDESQTRDTTIRCERMVITGSRVGKKVCHTEAEWAAMDRSADELMRDIGRSGIPYVAPEPGVSKGSGLGGFQGADNMGDIPR